MVPVWRCADRQGTALGGREGNQNAMASGLAVLPRQTRGPDSTGSTDLTLLVIEDDPAGTFTVPEMLDTAGKRVRVRTARNLTEAERLLTDDVHCILLDLALPRPPTARRRSWPCSGSVLELAPRHAVLALTASVDAERAAEAVRSAPRTTSSATSWTAGCSAAPSGTPWSANAPTWPTPS